MVHAPGIENDDCVFGDRMTIVCGVFRGVMRCTEPEWVTAALDLLPRQHANVAEWIVIEFSTSLMIA